MDKSPLLLLSVNSNRTRYTSRKINIQHHTAQELQFPTGPFGGPFMSVKNDTPMFPQHSTSIDFQNSSSSFPPSDRHFWEQKFTQKIQLTYQWKITIFNGKIHYKWSFSIAMLVHPQMTPHQTQRAYSTWATGGGTSAPQKPRCLGRTAVEAAPLQDPPFPTLSWAPKTHAKVYRNLNLLGSETVWIMIIIRIHCLMLISPTTNIYIYIYNYIYICFGSSNKN